MLTTFRRISKTQLKNRLKSLKDKEVIQVTLCPSKCYPNPNSYVDMSMTMDFSKEDLDDKSLYDEGILIGIAKLSQLDIRINAFYTYNCSLQLGKRVHFYIKEAE